MGLSILSRHAARSASMRGWARTGALSGMKRSPMTSTRREVILNPALMFNGPFPK